MEMEIDGLTYYEVRKDEGGKKARSFGSNATIQLMLHTPYK